MTLRLSTGLRQGLLGTDDLKALLDGGLVTIHTGSQPGSADDAATGTRLCVIYSLEPTTGLNFDAPVAGVLSKAAAESWQGTAEDTGTAGWFRFMQFDTDIATTLTNGLAASSANIRFDGAIAVSGAEMNLSNLAFVSGAVETISQFSITQPAN